MEWITAITDGPWYLDISAIAGVLVAIGVIWQKGLWPASRALWAAIVAAPQIAQGVREVVTLIESDVIGKLAVLTELFAGQEQRVAATVTRLDSQAIRQDELSAKLLALEQQVKALTERLDSIA